MLDEAQDQEEEVRHERTKKKKKKKRRSSSVRRFHLERQTVDEGEDDGSGRRCRGDGVIVCHETWHCARYIHYVQPRPCAFHKREGKPERALASDDREADEEKEEEDDDDGDGDGDEEELLGWRNGKR